MKTTQKGFALIEGLLIILILAIIGFGGYYVWHTKNNTDKSSKDAVGASQSTASTSSTSKSSQKYLTIKEWGVKAPYSEDLSLSYAIRAGDSNVAEFTSQNLIDAACQAQGAGGLITRYTADETANEPGANGSNATQFASTLDKDEYGHVGNYFFFFEHSQSACNPDSSITVQQQTNNAVKALMSKFQALPQ